MSAQYRRGDKVRQELGETVRTGVVVRVQGTDITVQWDRGGFPQILPLEQRVRFEKVLP